MRSGAKVMFIVSKADACNPWTLFGSFFELCVQQAACGAAGGVQVIIYDRASHEDLSTAFWKAGAKEPNNGLAMAESHRLFEDYDRMFELLRGR